MKDEFKNQLDAIFSKHEEKENKIIELKDRKSQQEDAFLKKFLDVSESVVKPAFEEVGFLAKGKGLNYRIDKRADVTAYDGKHVRACISICFYFGDNSYRPFHEFPNLSITCDKNRQTVSLHQSNSFQGRSGKAGPVGEFQIEMLTADFIQDKLIYLLSEILT